MRAVKLSVVHPEAVVTPWYKTRRAVMAGKVLWWLLTFLWGLAEPSWSRSSSSWVSC